MAAASDPPEDEMIELLLDHALDPYRGKFDPERLQAVRDALGDVLAAHPAGRASVRALLADALVDDSGTVRRGGDADDADDEQRRKRRISRKV
ncbi:MAG: hypothetical protein U0414_21930 [Polyangiaceae bacterium]